MRIFKKFCLGLSLVLLVMCLQNKFIFASGNSNNEWLFSTEKVDLDGDGISEIICLYNSRQAWLNRLIVSDKNGKNIFPTQDYIIRITGKTPSYKIMTFEGQKKLFLVRFDSITFIMLIEFTYSGVKHELYPYRKTMITRNSLISGADGFDFTKVFASVEKNYPMMIEFRKKVAELTNLAIKGNKDQIENLILWEGHAGQMLKDCFYDGLKKTKSPLPLFVLNIDSGAVATNISYHEGDSEIYFSIDYKDSKIYVENHR